MNRRRIALLAAAALLVGAFLFLPVVPYSVPNDRLAFLGVKATASVSPSYAATGCGVVYNPAIGSTFGSFTVQSSVWSGLRWTCGTGWTEIFR